jgi:hypothetical protein
MPKGKKKKERAAEREKKTNSRNVRRRQKYANMADGGEKGKKEKERARRPAEVSGASLERSSSGESLDPNYEYFTRRVYNFYTKQYETIRERRIRRPWQL